MGPSQFVVHRPLIMARGFTVLWQGGERVSDISSHMRKPTDKVMINTQRKMRLNFALATYENHSSSAAQRGICVLKSKD